MDKRKLALMLGLVAIGALIALRARAARRLEAPPLALPELDPIRIDAPELVIAGVPYIKPPPLGAFDQFSIAVGDAIGPAVDQVKDALKGLGLWSRKVPEKYRALFAMTGSTYRLPPGLLEAVAYRESRFREDIITGKVRSSAGAVGIMQIIPRWHPELGEAGALDPLRAVPYAARYLRQLFERFGTWQLALAAYNWGQGNLSKAINAGTPAKWPAETVAYVAEISGNAGLA